MKIESMSARTTRSRKEHVINPDHKWIHYRKLFTKDGALELSFDSDGGRVVIITFDDEEVKKLIVFVCADLIPNMIKGDWP